MTAAGRAVPWLPWSHAIFNETEGNRGQPVPFKVPRQQSASKASETLMSFPGEMPSLFAASRALKLE